MDIINSANFKNIVIAGDLNAKSQEWGNDHYNLYGRRWETFLHQKGLVCVNDGRPTKRLDSSVIDLVVVNPSLVPKIAFCGALAHEIIRSDHIGVLLEVGSPEVAGRVTVNKFLLGKTDWPVWEEKTKNLFSNWNLENEDKVWSSVDEMYESFIQVFNTCRDESVPQKQFSGSNRRLSPPWLSDKVKDARHTLNKAKKSYRRRSTDQNYSELVAAKTDCETAESDAKEEWVKSVCEKLNTTRNPKEIWESFKQLTSYQLRDGCEVLPLMDSNNKPVFDKGEKLELLQDAFFSGKHLETCEFDNNFRLGIEAELEHIGNTAEPVEPLLDIEDLERPVTLEETVAALSNLTKGKAAGPDKVFTDLLLSANSSLVTAHTGWVRYQQSGKLQRSDSSERQKSSRTIRLGRIYPSA